MCSEKVEYWVLKFVVTALAVYVALLGAGWTLAYVVGDALKTHPNAELYRKK